MTLTPISDTTDSAQAETQSLSIVDQLCLGSPIQAGSISAFIGVAAERENKINTYFQYTGDNTLVPLPSNTIFNVRFTGLSIAEDVYDGKFQGDKLNVFLETQNGDTVMMTSGITTWWSRSIITAIDGLRQSNKLGSLVNLSSYYKGMACFCTVYNGKYRVTSNDMFSKWMEINNELKAIPTPDKLAEAQYYKKIETVMRDSVSILSEMLTGVPVEDAQDEMTGIQEHQF